MWPNPQLPADLVTFNEEILSGKLHLLCSVVYRRETSRTIATIEDRLTKFSILDVWRSPGYVTIYCKAFITNAKIILLISSPCQDFIISSKSPLTLSVPEKLKNLLFEIPIISQNLNINNKRTTIVKSINLHIIRKLIEDSLKSVVVKAMFTLTVFEILLFEGR